MFKVGVKSKSGGSDTGRRPKLSVTQGGFMSKRRAPVEDHSSSEASVFCGIDVSAATLSVAVQAAPEWGLDQRPFANSPAGHKQLLA